MIKVEEGDYFNDEQKRAKQEVTEETIRVFWATLNKYDDIFDGYLKAQLINTVVIYFMSDVMANFFIHSNASNIKDSVMKGLFKCIKERLDDNLKTYKEKMMN